MVVDLPRRRMAALLSALLLPAMVAAGGERAAGAGPAPPMVEFGTDAFEVTGSDRSSDGVTTSDRTARAVVGRPSTSRLAPVTPCRLLDTRDHGEAPTRHAVLTVPVAGVCGVPDDAVAASLTVTAIEPTAAGHLAVYPSGTVWPGTSTVNVAAGEVRANGAIVRLGANGAVAVRVQADGHVVVEVSAAFVPAVNSAAGRLVAVERRLVDTRAGSRPSPGGTVRVARPSVVPIGATAVAVSLMTTDSLGPGYFTAHPAGGVRPDTSVLNTDGVGQTRAATVVVPLGDDGFDVFTSGGDHVIVDLQGYFTGPNANRTATGLFVPIRPTRLADTRRDGEVLHRAGEREWSTASVVGDAGAVVANVTMADPVGDGVARARASRTPREELVGVSAAEGETVANLALVPVSTTGLAVHASVRTHVVVDVTGWFTGVPRSATLPAPVNAVPGPGRVLIVGDSVASAFRYSTGALTHLQGYPYELDVRECRRTIGTSCVIRGGTRPSTAVDAIRGASGSFDTIVMMTGYNDSAHNFASAIDQVMAAARSKGVTQVVWLTLRAGASSNYAGINSRIWAAPARHADAKVADWNAHSGAQRGWFAADNVHLNGSGASALARFIDDALWRLS